MHIQKQVCIHTCGKYSINPSNLHFMTSTNQKKINWTLKAKRAEYEIKTHQMTCSSVQYLKLNWQQSVFCTPRITLSYVYFWMLVLHDVCMNLVRGEVVTPDYLLHLPYLDFLSFVTVVINWDLVSWCVVCERREGFGYEVVLPAYAKKEKVYGSLVFKVNGLGFVTRYTFRLSFVQSHPSSVLAVFCYLSWPKRGVWLIFYKSPTACWKQLEDLVMPKQIRPSAGCL